MLYDIVPPLAFFASLGGIILIVSRVILRVRHAKFVMDVESKVAALDNQDVGHIKKLAHIIGPTRKNIHAIKTPFAMVKYLLLSTKQRFNDDLKHRQVTKQEKIQQKASAKNLPSKSGQGIKSPLENIRDKFSTMLISTKSTIKKQAKHIKQGTNNLTNQVKKLRPQTKQGSLDNVAQSHQVTETPLSDRSTSSTRKPISSIKLSKVSVRPKTSRIESDKSTPTQPADAQLSKKRKVSAGEIPSSRASLRKLFNKESDQPQTALNQAREALGKDEHELVEEILVPYIIKHPRDARAYMLLGKAASQQAEWDDAVQAFEQVVSLNPKTKNCFAELGRAKYKAGHITKAIEMLQRAHNRNPQNTDVIKDLIDIAQKMDNHPMQQSLKEELRELEQG